jgi:hypothetical protein
VKDIYLAMLELLVIIRETHSGYDSKEEDKLLDIMDAAWRRLAQWEIDEIQKLPAYSIIKGDKVEEKLWANGL